ncbi:MAG: nucleotide exchange factor GrpE [bacterium]|nr:nucleotide exchange factor GrpE [bacterium]
MPEEKKDTHEEDIVVEESPDDVSGIKTDAVKKLKEKLSKCLEERKEYLDGWQRMKADSINLKKEEEKKRAEIGAFIKEDIINQLLPVLDSFDLAFKNTEVWTKVDENWRKGVEYIHSQLMSVLKENGLTEINGEGEPFSSLYYVVTETTATDKKGDDGKIAKVIQKGYRAGESTIRPAHVTVFEYKNESN